MTPQLQEQLDGIGNSLENAVILVKIVSVLLIVAVIYFTNKLINFFAKRGKKNWVVIVNFFRDESQNLRQEA